MFRPIAARRGLPLAVLVAGALALAACAGRAPAGTHGSRAPTPVATIGAVQPGGFTHVPADRCSLLTAREVSAVVGVAVDPPASHTAGDANIGANADGVRSSVKATGCFYAATAGTGRAEITYYVGSPGDIATSYAQLKMAAASAQPVSDLGDDAFWDGTYLVVLRGNVFVKLRLVGLSARLAPGTPALLAAQRQLAVIILGGL